MIKRTYGEKEKTLKEARIHINQILKKHDDNIICSNYLARKAPTYIEDQANIMLTNGWKNCII